MIRKILSTLTLIAFSVSTLITPASAQMMTLPAPGTMVAPSVGFNPVVIQGLKVFPENPLQFEFIIDAGDLSEVSAQSSEVSIKEETQKLVRYFLASLAVPEEDMWVNLSPYEKNRIVPEKFGQTQMGRDLLAQDYLLKQITSSMMHPKGEVGQKLWKRIHAKAKAEYGDVNIPVNTFNKVWIVPQTAEIYTENNVAFITESHLKVMLEEDYVALENHRSDVSRRDGFQTRPDNWNGLKPFPTAPSSQIIRGIVIPELEREVNNGQHFAKLRQIYNSMILATWYKYNVQNSVVNQLYSNRRHIAGVESDDPDAKQKIYEMYTQAFQKGAYDTIIEEYDPVTQDTVPTQYFSGGINVSEAMMTPGEERPASTMGAERGIFRVGMGLGSEAITEGSDQWSVVSGQKEEASTAMVSPIAETFVSSESGIMSLNWEYFEEGETVTPVKVRDWIQDVLHEYLDFGKFGGFSADPMRAALKRVIQVETPEKGKWIVYFKWDKKHIAKGRYLETRRRVPNHKVQVFEYNHETGNWFMNPDLIDQTNEFQYRAFLAAMRTLFEEYEKEVDKTDQAMAKQRTGDKVQSLSADRSTLPAEEDAAMVIIEETSEKGAHFRIASGDVYVHLREGQLKFSTQNENWHNVQPVFLGVRTNITRFYNFGRVFVVEAMDKEGNYFMEIMGNKMDTIPSKRLEGITGVNLPEVDVSSWELKKPLERLSEHELGATLSDERNTTFVLDLDKISSELRKSYWARAGQRSEIDRIEAQLSDIKLELKRNITDLDYLRATELDYLSAIEYEGYDIENDRRAKIKKIERKIRRLRESQSFLLEILNKLKGSPDPAMAAGEESAAMAGASDQGSVVSGQKEEASAAMTHPLSDGTGLAANSGQQTADGGSKAMLADIEQKLEQLNIGNGPVFISKQLAARFFQKVNLLGDNRYQTEYRRRLQGFIELLNSQDEGEFLNQHRTKEGVTEEDLKKGILLLLKLADGPTLDISSPVSEVIEQIGQDSVANGYYSSSDEMPVKVAWTLALAYTDAGYPNNMHAETVSYLKQLILYWLNAIEGESPEDVEEAPAPAMGGKEEDPLDKSRTSEELRKILESAVGEGQRAQERANYPGLVVDGADEDPAQVGGIDLDPAKLKMNTIGELIQMQMPQNIEFYQNLFNQPLVPQILHMTPVLNLSSVFDSDAPFGTPQEDIPAPVNTADEDDIPYADDLYARHKRS